MKDEIDRVERSINQNDCSQCRYFDGSKKCSIKQGSPTRSCIIGINRNFIESTAPGDDVLEIGCGSWSYLRDILPETVNWTGIDITDTKITLDVGSVGDLPYSENSFNYVISSASIEHWYSSGVPLRRGICEISRVLKKEVKHG